MFLNFSQSVRNFVIDVRCFRCPSVTVFFFIHFQSKLYVNNVFIRYDIRDSRFTFHLKFIAKCYERNSSWKFKNINI